MVEFHTLTLRFRDDDLEQTWDAVRARESLRPFRGTTVVAIVLYVCFVVLDQSFHGGVTWQLLIVRGVVCGLLAILLWLSWTAAWWRFDGWIVAGAVLVSGGGIVALLAVGREEAHLHWAGLMLALMSIYGLFRPQFPASIALSLTLIVAFNAVVIPSGILPLKFVIADNFFLLAMGVVGCLVTYSLERGSRERFLVSRNLHEEQQRSERLLRNILPGPIAERLKAGEELIADQLAAVTVLFADISNFTSMTANMSAGELVHLLEDVFHEFDRIAEDHGVEKVKTIGDACMMVAGVPESHEDHAARMVEAALDMQRRIEGLRVGDQQIRLHIGIATGTVVAGVIGRKKFSYDLWGDVVNTASRMASLAERGSIQVTEDVVRELGDRYTFRPRGPIEVKGKGLMPTWFLEGPGADSSQEPAVEELSVEELTGEDPAGAPV